ncbi:mercuric transporter MerT family protein [Undibacterium oligocarboniphilum]|jgi:mercuric ion transport protein|uniref:Mercuric transport protein MerT n=1 Tax=Undibacterium oligocarboniphilum TaxID=666702 RepID=A0A850QSX1_9BURK|nr:mercuric transporter MerT family protein [Undibacterium oligocarboniphilum]MBC3871876.1 mercury transporter MerT [Undibacterium oligocarboniphilum]NVO79464.1 mercury transporter MerT [Undibacterium oligocarboniphilum]
MKQLGGKSALVAGMLAAIAASVCCVGPLVLFVLGIGGAWASNMTALEPYRPIFICLTLLFLGWAFRKLYLVSQICTPGTPCADPRKVKQQRIIFWVVTALIFGLLAVPRLALLFY